MQEHSTLPLLLVWCLPRRRCSVYMGPYAVQPVLFLPRRKDRELSLAPGGVRGAVEGNARKLH